MIFGTHQPCVPRILRERGYGRKSLFRSRVRAERGVRPQPVSCPIVLKPWDPQKVGHRERPLIVKKRKTLRGFATTKIPLALLGKTGYDDR